MTNLETGGPETWSGLILRGSFTTSSHTSLMIIETTSTLLKVLKFKKELP